MKKSETNISFINKDKEESESDFSTREKKHGMEMDNKFDGVKVERTLKEDTYSEKSIDLKVRKNNKNYSKTFKCEKCEKSYTWYSGLSNHKRFVHNKTKESNNNK